MRPHWSVRAMANPYRHFQNHHTPVVSVIRTTITSQGYFQISNDSLSMEKA